MIRIRYWRWPRWRSRRRPSRRWASGSKCNTIIRPAANSLVPNADAVSFPNFRGYRWSKVPKRCAGTKGEVRRAMAPVRWRNKCAVHFILTVLAEQCLSIGRSCTWGSVTRRRRGLLSQVCSDRWAVDRDNSILLYCSVLVYLLLIKVPEVYYSKLWSLKVRTVESVSILLCSFRSPSVKRSLQYRTDFWRNVTI